MSTRSRSVLTLGALVLTLALVGCADDDTARGSKPATSSSVTLVADEGDCDCTGEARALERLADGRAKKQTGTVTLGG